MTLTHAVPWSNSLVELLVDSAIRAVIFAAVAGIGIALFRVKSTSLRLFTWTGVLYGALAIPLLASLLPGLPVPMPSFVLPEVARLAPTVSPKSRPAETTLIPSTNVSVRVEATNSQAPSASEVSGLSLTNLPGNSTANASERKRKTSISWLAIVGEVYVVIALFLLVRLCLGLLLRKRLVSRSRTIQDARVERSLASHLSSRINVRILESDFVAIPVTAGTMRPNILLPASWRDWDDAKLDAVIAHELSHVTRRDALTQVTSQIYRALFWFSPLSWWLDRQLNLLAEQASDEAALSRGVDRTEYAKTLLGFFETLHAAPGRVWWQGISMAKVGQAEHRLEKILSWRGVVNMGVKRSVLVAMIALAVPAIYVTAAARPANHNAVLAQSDRSAQEPAPAVESDSLTPPPEPALAPAAPAAPVHGVVAKGVTAPPTPAAPAAPAIPPAPAALWSGQDHSVAVRRSHGFSYSYGFDDEQRFVIATGNSDTFTMSGSTEDVRHVQKLKKQIPGDFIWFQRDEKSYIIRDQATVDRARKLWAPQEELGKKQEELGKQQEALGKQQAELGEKMEQIHVKVPDMTARIDKLKAEMKQLSSGATVEQVGKLQEEIGELQSEIGEIQSHAGDQQSKVGEEMGALGEKQGELGEKQGELGRQQGELAEKASQQMKALLDEAIKNGTAKPEMDSEQGASL